MKQVHVYELPLLRVPGAIYTSDVGLSRALGGPRGVRIRASHRSPVGHSPAPASLL